MALLHLESFTGKAVEAASAARVRYAQSRTQGILGSPFAGNGLRHAILLSGALLLGVVLPATGSAAKVFPQGPVFSWAFADNNNPYDAPVPGFIGPDGEGTANFFDMSDREDPGPIDEYGKRNYVNPVFLSWADYVVAYEPAPGVAPFWQYTGEVLDEVTGDNFSVVSLGDIDGPQIAAGVQPGYLIVSFTKPLYDAPGADLVIFENGFISEHTTGAGSKVGEMFAELAYVEISSNGTDYVRFPSISRTPGLVGAYGTIDPRNVYNLVGKHANAYGKCWGTPFDFAELADTPEVQSGKVDLSNIRYIKIVDIPGSGDYLDSLGHPIYDAWVTWGSGGADIEAIGAISQPYYYAEWVAKQNIIKPTDDMDTFVPIGGELEDPDRDGLPNVLEYVLARDPRVADAEPPLTFSHDSASDQFTISFTRDVRVADYALVLEHTASLAEPVVWEPLMRLGPQNEQEIISPKIISSDSVSLLPQASLGVIRRYEVKASRTALPKNFQMEFFRLRIESVAPQP